VRWSDIVARYRSGRRPNPLVTVVSGLVGFSAYLVMSRQTWLSAAVEIGGYLVLSWIGYFYIRGARRIWGTVRTAPPASTLTPSAVEGPP
jgi:threonine/homoserine/homoserine lactone efflux protein